MLIRYMCAWLGLRLLVLDVHGGTTVEDIVTVFERAEAFCQADNSSVYVFLDEVNTCAHMGLICEILCHRSMNGKRIHEGIRSLAALNPYRIRANQVVNEGLVFSRSAATTDDPMRQLVYRVHPIPPTIQDFLFDFGSLTPDTELIYIESILQNKASDFKDMSKVELSMIALFIDRSQRFVRDAEEDCSVVSLRDVQRCVDLFAWFSIKFGPQEKWGTEVCILSLEYFIVHELCITAGRREY